MVDIINIPNFVTSKIDIEKMTKIQKLFLIIKGKAIAFLFKKTSKKLFCILMNFIYSIDGKLYFEDNHYIKKTKDFTVYYPNKRISNIIVDIENHYEKFIKSYCLDKIEYSENNLVVDVGANVGDLYNSLKILNLNFRYIGFEPDVKVFKCLENNIDSKNSTIYNLALSNADGNSTLYIDTEAADTSLTPFNSKSSYETEITTLDSFEITNIKLIKIDAEGHEPEVLEGMINTLSEIEYISIDYGRERGFEKTSTMVDVINYLYKNNFKLINQSDIRDIGLFYNKNFEK